MNVSLIRYTPDPEALCGEAAAICTASEDYQAALRGALTCGHDSVIEHAVFTFKVEGVSRILLAQLTRHRIASFGVESQRYVDMEGFAAIEPPSIVQNSTLFGEYLDLLCEIEGFYHKAKAFGIPKEDARYILPMATSTRLIVTMNARELMHFFELRCCNRAQWEIRKLADRMLAECRRVAPEIFGHAGCSCMQNKPCPEGRKSCKQPRNMNLQGDKNCCNSK